jgi:hypothetical protein
MASPTAAPIGSRCAILRHAGDALDENGVHLDRAVRRRRCCGTRRALFRKGQQAARFCKLVSERARKHSAQPANSKLRLEFKSALGQGSCLLEMSSQGKRHCMKQIVCAGLGAALHRPRVKRCGIFVSGLSDRRIPQRHVCFVHHEIKRTLPKRAVGVSGRLVGMAQDRMHLRR